MRHHVSITLAHGARTDDMSSSSPDERSGQAADHAGRRMRWIVVVLGIVFAIAFLAAVVFLHVTGRVGPGAH